MNKRGYIEVNDRLETNVPGIYAIGDIKGPPAFTHISYDDFRILRTNLIEHGNASIHNRLVPYTVFIDPQLGRVGLSESEAKEQGRNIRVAKMPMNYVARALEVDESRGFMKAIVDADTRADSWCCHSRFGGRRNHVNAGDSDDGQIALYNLARWCFCPSVARRVIE